MSDFAADLFAEVAWAESPQQALEKLTAKELEILIDGLCKLAAPNEFQAQVFALAMMQVLARWKNSPKL